MRVITAKRRTHRCGFWPYFVVGAGAAILMSAAGCSTPYTRRIDQLDDAYQRGDMSREDYMRFVHEAEGWEAK